MGSDEFDCIEDRLHGRDVAQVGATGERDRGKRPGLTSDERERMKGLERENRELRQANEILRKASAYFAQAELDRRSKP
jgi:transposase-like protein